MKNILALLVIFTISPGVLLAQVVQVSSSSVRDYGSFKKYVEFEQSKLTTKPLTLDSGGGRNKLKKMGIEFAPGRNWAYSKDRKKTAYLSPDRKGVALVDGATRSVNILNDKGEVIQRIPVKRPIEGLLGFSETRFFDFKGGFGDYEGGFYIYDFNGELVRSVADSGIVDRFAVSNNQKYFAITSGTPDFGDFIALYDMQGERIWRTKIDALGDSEIMFTRDDKFLLLKVPGTKTAYLFFTGTGEQISKEQYAE